jgi:FKBP12-rapamycin complex-associated protein
MRENFMDTAESILRFRTSRDPLVRKMVITLIPTLAVYDTQTFSEHFLHKAMGHLLTLLSKSNERAFGTPNLSFNRFRSDPFVEAFIAIGHIAKAVGSDMKPFLDSIMGQVKLGLQNRG